MIIKKDAANVAPVSTPPARNAAPAVKRQTSSDTYAGSLGKSLLVCSTAILALSGGAAARALSAPGGFNQGTAGALDPAPHVGPHHHHHGHHHGAHGQAPALGPVPGHHGHHHGHTLAPATAPGGAGAPNAG